MSDGSSSTKKLPRLSPTRVFVRGLAISLPAILTIVILLWIANGIGTYIIDPTTMLVKRVIAEAIDGEVISTNDDGLVTLSGGPELSFCGRNYVVKKELRDAHLAFVDSRTANLKEAADSSMIVTLDRYFRLQESERRWLTERALYPDRFWIPTTTPLRDDPVVYVPFGNEAVPYSDYANVAQDTQPSLMPTTATQLYMELATRQYFKSAFLLSAFAVSIVVILIYFLGRFVSVRLGSWFVHRVETNLLGRLPVVSNVYGSAKQVTDFLFSETQVEYRRVVAIEYPRRGVWSLGLVTGESMLDITAAIGEPCLSVLIPSSPMPVTGYTMNVPRSEVLDLNISVDQAFQFCISCGVLVPPHQKVTPELLQQELTRRLSERMKDSGTVRFGPPLNPPPAAPPSGDSPPEENSP